MQYTFPKDTGAAVRENVVRAPGPGRYNIHPGVGKQVCNKYAWWGLSEKNNLFGVLIERALEARFVCRC